MLLKNKLCYVHDLLEIFHELNYQFYAFESGLTLRQHCQHIIFRQFHSLTCCFYFCHEEKVRSIVKVQINYSASSCYDIYPISY